MKRKIFPFKRLFFAYSFAFMPFALVLAILSLLGVTPIYSNGKAYYGVQGFFLSVLLIPFFGVIMAVVNWIFLNFGDYLYTCVLRIWGKEKEKYRE